MKAIVQEELKMSKKQDNAEHTPISHGPCLPLIPITDHEDAEFLSTPIAQSQPRDSPMDNEVCSNKDSPQQIHTQTDSPHTVSHDISHEPQDNPTSQPVDSSPLSTDHSAKAFLKFSSPTLGLANKKAVTGMSGLNGLTAMSVAFSVAMDAPKLAPVTVMLTFSSLYRSTSLATSSHHAPRRAFRACGRSNPCDSPEYAFVSLLAMDQPARPVTVMLTFSSCVSLNNLATFFTCDGIIPMQTLFVLLVPWSGCTVVVCSAPPNVELWCIYIQGFVVDYVTGGAGNS
nr:Os05g0574200 [Ipomoea batatas]